MRARNGAVRVWRVVSTTIQACRCCHAECCQYTNVHHASVRRVRRGERHDVHGNARTVRCGAPVGNVWCSVRCVCAVRVCVCACACVCVHAGRLLHHRVAGVPGCRCVGRQGSRQQQAGTQAGRRAKAAGMKEAQRGRRRYSRQCAQQPRHAAREIVSSSLPLLPLPRHPARRCAPIGGSAVVRV